MQKGRSRAFKGAVSGGIRPLYPIIFEGLSRIGKDALANAFRHSVARSIEAELNYELNQLRMRNRDDGARIDPNILKEGCRSLFRRWILFVISLCLCVPGAWATSAADSSTDSQYIRTDFTVDDGLPDNTVDAVTQTDNGLLWLGTESGLASFDGRTFTPVRLRIPGAASPGAINSLVVGSDGDLWVGSDAGIVRIPKRDLDDSYFADSTAYRLGNQQSDEVGVLFKARDGTIWAGTNHGLYRFDSRGFICVLPSEYISRINQAPNGRLMLITGSGFVEYDGKEAIRHPGLGARFGVHDDQVFDAYQDSDGTIWYCTNEGIRPVLAQHTGFLSPYQPAHTAAYRIHVDGNGALWVSTGIGVYRIEGRQMWTPAPNVHARSFYAGKDGDLWIATNGSGLVHLQPRLVRMYTDADGLPNNNIAMAVLPARDGRLWVGYNCGLAVFDGKRFKTYAEKDGLANSCVWALAEDQQRNIWIGSYGGGLFRFRDGVFKQYTLDQGLASRIVFQITVAQDDSLWIATPDGLSHMQGSTIRNYVTADGLSSNRILDIHQDRRGNIWVATQAGVDRLVSDRFAPVPTTQTADEVLPRHFVETSDGDLYTTDLPQGVSQIRNGQVTLLDDALSLMEMVAAPGHSLWFSGRNGLIRMSEPEFALVGKSSAPLDYEVFNRADGLNTTQASVGAPNIAMTSDGKIWIATVKGLAMIDTLHLPLSGPSPKTFVSGIESDGRKSPVGDRLVLQPGVHHVELQLAAINLSNPQKIRLQYRMEGVDSDWLDGTSSRTAIYTNIPAGTHRVLVRATDNVGHWNAPEVVYQVTQQPPLYAKPLFQASTAVGVAFLLVLAYRLRLSHVTGRLRKSICERTAEREKIARDLHDTFFQSIQGLLLQFNTAVYRLQPGHPARGMLEEALNQSDQVMAEGRELLVHLHATTSRPDDLPTALANYGEQLQKGHSRAFKAAVSGSIRPLHPIIFEELSRIGKEALANAFRHSMARSIEAELNYETNQLRMCIRDDGAGIDPHILKDGRRDGHLGLPSMRERAKNIGAQLDLWSRSGVGTEIELRISANLAYASGRPADHHRFWQRRGPAKADCDVG